MRRRDGPYLAQSNIEAHASFVVGGQIRGETQRLFHVYSEGNFIEATPETCYFQIGESKYGKFMLELGVRAHVSGQKAIKMALSSMVSTAHANLSVGPPYDIGVYRNGSHTVEQYRIDTDSGYLDELQEAWIEHMLEAVDLLPPIPADLGT